jgi:hypothetical protein
LCLAFIDPVRRVLLPARGQLWLAATLKALGHVGEIRARKHIAAFPPDAPFQPVVQAV